MEHFAFSINSSIQADERHIASFTPYSVDCVQTYLYSSVYPSQCLPLYPGVYCVQIYLYSPVYPSQCLPLSLSGVPVPPSAYQCAVESQSPHPLSPCLVSLKVSTGQADNCGVLWSAMEYCALPCLVSLKGSTGQADSAVCSAVGRQFSAILHHSCALHYLATKTRVLLAR